jgi:hypothetical protein
MDLQDKFTQGQNALVFFPDQYFQTDFYSLEAELRRKDSTLQVGFVTVHNGNTYWTIFFVAKSVQLLWDCASLFKNTLQSRWLAFHVNAFMLALQARALKEGVTLNVKEVFADDFDLEKEGLSRR